MITLVPMTDEEYKSFLDVAIEEYAQDHVKGGKWSADEALEQSAEEFRSLLPDGIHTAGHYLCSVQHDALGIVGVLWYAISVQGNKRTAFIYDIRVYDEFQGQGFGTESLQALEGILRAENVSSIGLHVFGHNQRAFNLYVKLGYIATNIRMSKELIEEK